MKNAIIINNANVSIKEYHGQRVLTFKDIDTAHKRPDGTAGRNFRSNKKHFIEGEDFFKIQPDEIRRVGISSPNGGIVLTESGYLMLVKSFTDDLAWDVQRQLVKHYFRGRTEAPQGKQLRLDEKPYEYYDKTWNGEPVLSSDDFAHMTGLSRGFVSWHFRKSDFTEGVDFYYLKGDDLSKFKHENPKCPKYVNHLYLLTKSGFRKLCTHGGVKLDEPQCFIEQRKELKRFIAPDWETKNCKNSHLLCAVYQLMAELGITNYGINRETADKLGYRGSSITGQSILVKYSSGELKQFTDSDSGEFEKALLVMKNIGRVIFGQYRESKDGVPLNRNDYEEESRIFAASFLAQYFFQTMFNK